MRKLDRVDKLLGACDDLLRAARTTPVNTRPSPAENLAADDLSEDESLQSAALMRVNHAGEVCAQCLYLGQALTAGDSAIEARLRQAAADERDHLAWCHQRLRELDAETSVLNPLWAGASFIIGVAAGLSGGRTNLGFVAATEENVVAHLQEHLTLLPERDQRSRAILSRMVSEERGHGDEALSNGGTALPPLFRKTMARVAKLMTRTSQFL